MKCSSRLCDNIHIFLRSYSPLLLVLLITIILKYSEIDIFIDLADEGFLWYGTWRTYLGEVPILDFQSYDPGRYYWGALWSKIFGDGIVALRISSTIFQCIGLSYGMAVIRRLKAPWWYQVASGVILSLWMFPRFNLFESSIAMAGVYYAMLIIEKPSLSHHFMGGVFVGLSAFFGRNFGVYGVMAFLMVIHLTWIKFDKHSYLKRISAWSTGIVTGYLPMLAMILIIPGFYDQFIASILELFHHKATNIPLQLPWPWITAGSILDRYSVLGGISTLELMLSRSREIIIGLALVTWIIFISGTMIFIYYFKPFDRHKAVLSVFIASAIFSIPYFHYFISRADIDHLGRSIHPLIIGLVSIPFFIKEEARKKYLLILQTMLAIATLLSVLKSHPVYQIIKSTDVQLDKIDIGEDTLLLDKYTSNVFHSLKSIQNICGNSANILIIPHWPTAYVYLRQKSPIREIYLLVNETNEKQNQIIKEIRDADVNCVVLGNVRLDDKEELMFRNTHPLVFQYLINNYEDKGNMGLPDNYSLMMKF